jgi:hypothetical protein
VQWQPVNRSLSNRINLTAYQGLEGLTFKPFIRLLNSKRKGDKIMRHSTFNPYAQRIRSRNTAAFNRACTTGRFDASKPNSTDVSRPAVPKPVFEYFIEHRGMKVIITNHARQQLKRRRDLDIERQKTWFVNAIDGLAQHDWTPKFENHEVFIYSKAMKQGFVIAFRRDFKNAGSDKMCMVAVTAYPKGRRKGMHSDTEVIYV